MKNATVTVQDSVADCACLEAAHRDTSVPWLLGENLSRDEIHAARRDRRR